LSSEFQLKQNSEGLEMSLSFPKQDKMDPLMLLAKGFQVKRKVQKQEKYRK
jgi:hypothetical protein